MAKSKKSKNFLVRYFVPFGIRQLCDLSMVAGFITLIVGMIVYKTTPMVMLAGLCLFALGSLMAIFRSARVMMGGINKRSPEYKGAIVNLVLMAAIFALAVIGLVFLIINM